MEQKATIANMPTASTLTHYYSRSSISSSSPSPSPPSSPPFAAPSVQNLNMYSEHNIGNVNTSGSIVILNLTFNKFVPWQLIRVDCLMRLCVIHTCVRVCVCLWMCESIPFFYGFERGRRRGLFSAAGWCNECVDESAPKQRHCQLRGYALLFS